MTATPNSIPKGSSLLLSLPVIMGSSLPEPEICRITLPPWEKLQVNSLPSIVVDTLRDRRTVACFRSYYCCLYVCSGSARRGSRIEVGICHSKDPSRAETIEQFRNGTLDVVVTTSVLERGVTFPRTCYGAVCGSSIVYMQYVSADGWTSRAYDRISRWSGPVLRIEGYSSHAERSENDSKA